MSKKLISWFKNLLTKTADGKTRIKTQLEIIQNKLVDTFGTLPTLFTLFAEARSLFSGKGLFNFNKESSVLTTPCYKVYLGENGVSEIEDIADDYVRKSLGYILHNNEEHYQNLYTVKRKAFAFLFPFISFRFHAVR